MLQNEIAMNGHEQSGSKKPQVQPGEYVEARIGRWVITRDYGKQFQCKYMQPVPPSSEADTVRYLASFFSGIGLSKAQKIVDRFGLVRSLSLPFVCPFFGLALDLDALNHVCFVFKERL